MFPRDLLAALPEPRDDEPSSLRSDIADELADHLQCAFRREVLKDGDAAAAQRRALNGFGDPQKLARRLWWQAMRSRLMRQRIVSGLQWLVGLTAMLISGAVFWQQSQLLAELRQSRQEDAAQRQALTAKLDQLQLPSATLGAPVTLSSDEISAQTYEPSRSITVPEGADFDINVLSSNSRPPIVSASDGTISDGDRGSPVLALRFVQETEDGPPVCPASVELTDSENVVHAGTISNNNVAYPSLEPDLYQLSVRLADGQQSERPVLIRDEKPRELTITCPAPRKKTPVSIAMKPLPDDLQKGKFEARLNVWAAPVEIGKARWTTPNLTSQTIRFDAQTGLPAVIDVGRSGSHFNLQDLPPDERRAFLPVGVVGYSFEASQRLVQPGAVRVYQWPESEQDALEHTVKSDETTWELDVPNEFFERIRSEIASANYGYGDPRAE